VTVSYGDVGGDVQQLSAGWQRRLINVDKTVEHELRPFGPFQRERTVQTVLCAAPHVTERYLLYQPTRNS